MTALNKRALRKAAMHAKTEDDWGCDADNFHDKATPDAVLALLDELEAAEKRMAELEAREVKLPKPISVLHRRDFNDAHRAIYAYPEAEVNAALAAAGIGVKGE